MRLPRLRAIAPRRAEDGGFSLIEVAVALAILSFSLLAVLPIYQAAIGRTRSAEARRAAVLAAENRLAQAARFWAAADGVSSGEDPPGLRWSVRVSPVDDDRPGGGPLLHEVSTTVRWGPGERDAVTLRTLTLGPR